MNKKYIMVLCAIVILLSLVMGCSPEDEKGKELKLELMQAISKQNEIESYSFRGSANLKLDLSKINLGTDLLTTALLSFFLDSEMTWQGVAAKNPAQLELLLNITPRDASSSIEVPILIKDNKLYFNIPAITLNTEDYLYIDLEKPIEETNSLFPAILNHLVGAIESQLYLEAETDGETIKTIHIEINEDNIKNILKSLNNNYPLIVEELQSTSLSEQQINSLQENLKDHLKDHLTQIDQPGAFSATLDENGFLTENTLNLYFSDQVIEISQRVNDINQNPAFQMDIPIENARSFQEAISKKTE